MKNYVIVDFKKEADPNTPASERIGFNDPIRHPNLNMHPANYGIYKQSEPTCLVCYIPTHLQDEVGMAQSLVDAVNNAVYAQ